VRWEGLPEDHFGFLVEFLNHAYRQEGLACYRLEQVVNIRLANIQKTNKVAFVSHNAEVSARLRIGEEIYGSIRCRGRESPFVVAEPSGATTGSKGIARVHYYFKSTFNVRGILTTHTFAFVTWLRPSRYPAFFETCDHDGDGQGPLRHAELWSQEELPISRQSIVPIPQIKSAAAISMTLTNDLDGLGVENQRSWAIVPVADQLFF
jgi:hypothetical protein